MSVGLEQIKIIVAAVFIIQNKTPLGFILGAFVL